MVRSGSYRGAPAALRQARGRRRRPTLPSICVAARIGASSRCASDPRRCTRSSASTPIDRSPSRSATSPRRDRSARPARPTTSSGPTRTRPTQARRRAATATVGRAPASRPVSRVLSRDLAATGTVIHLRRRLPAASSGLPEDPGDAPVSTAEAGDASSYLALHRVELARFTRGSGRPVLPARLCGAGPRLSADGCYPLPCVVELGLSSCRSGSPRRDTRPSGRLAGTVDSTRRRGPHGRHLRRGRRQDRHQDGGGCATRRGETELRASAIGHGAGLPGRHAQADEP